MIKPSANRWISTLWIAIFAYFMLTFWISLSYHWGYMSSLNDLGLFDQAIWGTLHGDFFLNTNNPFNTPMSYLGLHFRPVLLFFLPFYALAPKAEWMILAQSLALSLTAWPIYLLAKRVSKSESAGFFWALAYMLNPFVISVAAWIFRPVSLAVPFIAISLLAIEKKNFRLLLFSCFIIVLCKEHFGLMVMGFGVLWWLRNREWKQSLFLVSFGMVYSILILGVVMPALSPVGKHVMLAEGLGQVSRYSWLGHSITEILWKIITEPLALMKVVLLDFGGIQYIMWLLVFVCGFPLLGPEFLLPALGDLAANTLSANPLMRGLFAYHSVSIIPIFTVAAIYGIDRISRWQNKFSAKELTGFVVIASFIGGYCVAPLPLPGARNVWAPTHFLNLPDPNVPAIRSAIGDNASVSAQVNVGAHFSQRKKIYVYPNKVGEVDAIVLRLESPTTDISNLPGQPNLLDNQHLLMDRTEYIASIERLLSGKEYGVLLWNDPWLVLAKNGANHGSEQKVKQKLNRLRKEWQIK